MKAIVSELVRLLKEKKLTIALAESVTCGLASHQLNTVKGTSEIFLGGVVCYNETIKASLLEVPHALIKKYTAESQQVTSALAKNLRKLFPADVCAAITGLTTQGASASKAKPAGTIFFSFYYQNAHFKLKKKYNGTPLSIKRKACKELYLFIISKLKSPSRK